MPRSLVLAAVLLLVPLSLPPAAPTGDTVTSLTLSCNPNSGIQFLDHDDATTPTFVCSGHFGMHTYFVGANEVYRLRGGCFVGRVVEVGAVGVEAGLGVLPPIEEGVAVEVSLDGANWENVAYYEIPHNPTWVVSSPPDSATYFPRVCNRQPVANPQVGPGAGDVGYPVRATLFFVLPDTGQEFRFIRIRNPASHLGGVSGYMDTSGSGSAANPTFTGLLVEYARPAPAITTTGTIELDCATDIVDAVFPDHPCRYGGNNHFDAASKTHTYWLDHADLTRVSGSAKFQPFRPVQGALQAARWAGVGVPIKAYVQASCDGQHWANLGEFNVLGAGVDSPFNFALPAPIPTQHCPDARHARFLRLTTEQWVVSANSHWYAGMLTDSHLRIDGVVSALPQSTTAGSTRLAGQGLPPDPGNPPGFQEVPEIEQWTNATGWDE